MTTETLRRLDLVIRRERKKKLDETKTLRNFAPERQIILGKA